jgi:peptidoglycan endopeptidase LytE
MITKRTIGAFSLLGFLLAMSINAYAHQTYKVKKGDTLSEISAKFHVDIKQIKKDNHLSSNKLKPGTRLKIAKDSRDESKKTAKAEKQGKSSALNVKAKAAPAPKGELIYHKVKRGETLSGIAKKYHLSLKELKDLNGINTRKEARIKRGQRLIVGKAVRAETITAKAPAPETQTYIVRKGDTLYSVARKFDLTTDELKELNGLGEENLKRGQKLIVKKEEEEEETPALIAEPILANPPIAETPYSMQKQKLDNNLETLVQQQTYEGMSTKEKLVAFSKTMLDIPYKFGGNTLYGIDCSAFVQKVFSFLGLKLPRTAREQFNKGVTVSVNELSIGDLVFFRTYASFPSHVGIYIGENLFIHASSKNKKVTIDKITEPFYTKRFIAAKRLLTEEGMALKDQVSGGL